ncbi:hypothetical protein [Parapedobacter koreensis]|uniref:Uncharacterized protein n=1 Tax=Parapedobacter koreensis TaxID=332977 RepID=A0A1H7IMX3_9SPHI|nr:hypothetical protein [Parapedobacter koreensis]SEK63758.1 hypothetical protein SAMN05421740_102298 [Parapedobacter koreensis]
MANFIELIESSLSQKKGVEFVEQEIKLLFSAIAGTNKIDDAELLFKNLEDIQFVLAKSIFKNGIKVTSFLKKFVYDFDRIDDNDTKKNLYNKIKSEAAQ